MSDEQLKKNLINYIGIYFDYDKDTKYQCPDKLILNIQTCLED